MYENFAWEQFLITGNVETFMEYRKINALNNGNVGVDEKKGGIANEACQSERNSNTRSNV